jgi:tetratricopeptide (TPR) repeat protein
MGKNKKNQKQ